jgi:glycerol uptake facilitator-like aquaporin
MDFLRYLVELVGTFLFVYVILNVTNTKGRDDLLSAGSITITLLAMILIGGAVSGGGNFNPAVSVAKFMDGTIKSAPELTGYIFAQVVGAFLAFHFWKMTKKNI